MKTWFLYAFCALVFCYLCGCKKDSSSNPETSQNTEQFFSVPAYVPQIVKNIAEVMRRDNDNFNYIDDLTQKEGYALWDKSIVKIDRNGDSTVTIPLVKKDEKYTSSFFLARATNSNVSIDLIRGHEYEKYGFGQSDDSLNAKYITNMLMYLNNRIFGDTSFVVTDKRIYNTNEDTTYFIIRTPGKADRQVQGTTTYWVTECVQMMNVGNQGQLVGAPPGSTGDYYYENGYYCYSVPITVNTPGNDNNTVYINMNKNYIIKFNRSDRNDGYLNYNPSPKDVSQPSGNNTTPPVTPGSRPTRDAGSRYFEADPDLVDDEDKSWWDDKTTTFPPQALPKWADMDAAYPKDVNGNDLPGPLVYGVVGGAVLDLYNSNPKRYTNACALRVSMALNYSGVKIPYIPNQTFKGADNKYYFLGAAKLYNWMIKTFGTSNAIITTRALRGTTDFRTPILGKKGIYIMQPNSIPLFGATGHASLWNGSTCVSDHCFFDAAGGIAKLGFWELK